MVTDGIKRFVTKHEERLHKHENNEVIQLLDNARFVRKLLKTKTV